MALPALVVCQNRPVHEEIALALTGLKTGFETVRTASELLRTLSTPERPNLIVLDPSVPGGNRPDLLRLLRDAVPESVVVVIVDPEVEAPAPPVGALGVFRFILRPWTPEDLRTTLRAALRRSALLAENRRLARLHEEQKRVLWEENERLVRSTVESAKAIESTPSTAMPTDATARMGEALLEAYNSPLALHCRAVAGGARDLARSVGLPEETVARIETAGRLHDIGYLGLPRFLLARPPERLTDRERTEWEKHPLIGETIADADQGYADVARTIRHHHERFDGDGIPDGLKGEGIPLGARILAVADVHDLAYRRAAKSSGAPARTRARRALQQASGHELDPSLVESFLGGAVLMADAREIQVEIADLKSGMILTRDLRSSTDLFIAAGGTRLDDHHIDRIQAFHRRNPIAAEVFVRTT